MKSYKLAAIICFIQKKCFFHKIKNKFILAVMYACVTNIYRELNCDIPESTQKNSIPVRWKSLHNANFWSVFLWIQPLFQSFENKVQNLLLFSHVSINSLFQNSSDKVNLVNWDESTKIPYIDIYWMYIYS